MFLVRAQRYEFVVFQKTSRHSCFRRSCLKILKQYSFEPSLLQASTPEGLDFIFFQAKTLVQRTTMWKRDSLQLPVTSIMIFQSQLDQEGLFIPTSPKESPCGIASRGALDKCGMRSHGRRHFLVGSRMNTLLCRFLFFQHPILVCD